MIRRCLFTIALMLLCGLAWHGNALAADLFNGVDCSGATTSASDSAVCVDNTGEDPITGSDGALMNASNIVALIGGAAAIIIIIVGGIRYITSNGDSAKTTTARNTIINALIGLVVLASGKIIINFVLSKL